MLNAAFQLKLGQPVTPGLVASGKFDGKSPSLACGTTGGKIIIHSPHDHIEHEDESSSSFRFLNINRKVTALTTGTLSHGSAQDRIIIGTQRNVMANDVERNADPFRVNMQGRVRHLVVRAC